METQTNKKPFDPKSYIHVLASGLSLDVREIPPEILTEVLKASAPAQANKLVLDWHRSKPAFTAQEFDDDTKQLFASIITPANSPRVKQLERDTENLLAQARQSHTNARNYLKNAGEKRGELELLLNKGVIDLLPTIQKIVSDGWYTFDMTETKRYREWAIAYIYSNYGDILTFKTAPVVISHYNKGANVDMTVPMGRYYVDIIPRDNHVQVRKCENNTVSRGYIHPHISSGDSDSAVGNICWGNAEVTYSEGMSKYEYDKVLGALRIILTTYNEQSPYHSLGNFYEIARGYQAPPSYKFQQYGEQTLWLREGALPQDYDKSLAKEYVLGGNTSKDGTHVNVSIGTIVKLPIFRLLKEGTQDRLPNTYYFIRRTLADGTHAFHQLQEGASYIRGRG